MIHPFIGEHNSCNLQYSSENNSTIWPLSSDSFNRLKLLRAEIQPFDVQSDLWGNFFLIILNVLVTKTLFWVTYQKWLI